MTEKAKCKICNREESIQVLLYVTGICYECQAKKDFKELKQFKK